MERAVCRTRMPWSLKPSICTCTHAHKALVTLSDMSRGLQHSVVKEKLGSDCCVWRAGTDERSWAEEVAENQLGPIPVILKPLGLHAPPWTQALVLVFQLHPWGSVLLPLPRKETPLSYVRAAYGLRQLLHTCELLKPESMYTLLL